MNAISTFRQNKFLVFQFPKIQKLICLLCILFLSFHESRASVIYYPSSLSITSVSPSGSVCVGSPVTINFSYTNCAPAGQAGATSSATYTVNVYAVGSAIPVGSGSYTYSSSTPTSGTGSVSFTPTTGGTFTYYLKAEGWAYTGSGCASAAVSSAQTGSYTVNDLPITFTGRTSYCPGENLSLTAVSPSATGFSWTTPASATSINGLTTATISKTGIVLADAGTYTVTATGLGCTVSQSANIIVSSGTITGSGLASPSTILYGGSSQLSVAFTGAVQPVSYTWRDDNYNIISTSATPSVSPTVATTYQVHVLDACSASTDATVNVSVNPAGTACNGGAIIFKESMGSYSGTTPTSIGSYTGWTNGQGLIMSGTALVSSPTVTSGTNPTIAIIDAKGSGTAFINTSVATPSLTFKLSGINTSAYQNIVLSTDIYKASGTQDASNLVVTISDGVTTNTLPINSVDGSAATKLPTGNSTAATWYTVTFGGTYISGSSVSIEFSGCSQIAFDEVILKGNLKDPTGATASASSACQGQNVTLTASGFATGYRWYNSSTASNASFLSPNNPYTRAVAPGTNTYYVAATDGTCESSGKSSVSVTSIALPAAPAAGNQTACQGGVIPNITATIVGPVIDWYAAATGGSILAGGSGTSSFATGQTSQGTYTYYAESRNATGCVSATRTPVTLIIYAPSAIAGGPDNVCKSASPFAIALSGASLSGGATTGAWSLTSGSGTLSSTLQTANPSAVTFTPAANFSGTITLTLTTDSPGGCTPGTATRTINVSATTAPATPGITVVNGCNGSDLTATGYTGTLLWSTGETTPTIHVTAAATYTVSQTVGGCPSAPASATSAPQIVPAPVVTVVNNFNGSSDLTASGYTGTLLWSNAQTTASIHVLAAGTYTVTQTVGGCTSPPGSGVAAPSSSSGISGVINIYTKVTSVSVSACSVTVASTAGLAVGDKVLIIQMKGDPVTSTINDPTYGSLTSIGQAGNYEFAVISSLPGGSVIVFQGLVNSYDVSGNNIVQLVRVPKYGQATISGTLTAQPWNGTTGGVLAFEASYIIMNANITVDTMGFRGGKDAGQSASCFENNYTYAATGNAAERGEGIASTGASYGWGKAPLANAGGGGGSHNGGGGGGGNGGKGGKGGWMYDGCGNYTTDSTLSQGFGGYSLSSYFGANKIFMGGGAGCGQANGSTWSVGAPGGGIIIIKADSISNGGAFKISANARDNTYPPPGANGAGGGGGGGTVLLDIGKYKNTVTVEVKGGKGGDNSGSCYAPGAGGGGGLVWYKQSSRPAQITPNISGGIYGLSIPGGSCGISWGAKAGSAGVERFNLAIPLSTSCVPPLPISLLYFTATLENDQVLLQWASASEKNNDYFLVEKSADALNWEAFSRIQGSGNSSSVTNYSLYDPKPVKGINYYRLKQVDRDGATSYSAVEQVILQAESGVITYYPNPLDNDALLFIEYASIKNENIGISVKDILGRNVLYKKFSAVEGFNKFGIDLSGLAAGTYLLNVTSSETRRTFKIIVN
jgi:hypothetical protein